MPLAGEEVVPRAASVFLFSRYMLMRPADMAMYDSRPGTIATTFVLRTRTRDRMRGQGLRRAIETDSLEVNYQPQVVLAAWSVERWPQGNNGTDFVNALHPHCRRQWRYRRSWPLGAAPSL